MSRIVTSHGKIIKTKFRHSTLSKTSGVCSLTSNSLARWKLAAITHCLRNASDRCGRTKLIKTAADGWSPWTVISVQSWIDTGLTRWVLQMFAEIRIQINKSTSNRSFAWLVKLLTVSMIFAVQLLTSEPKVTKLVSVSIKHLKCSEAHQLQWTFSYLDEQQQQQGRSHGDRP